MKKKSATKMFEMKKLLEKNGLKKLGYLAKVIDVSEGEIADIIEVDPAIVQVSLKQGAVPGNIPGAKDISERLHLLYILLSSLLRFDDYTGSEIKHLFDDTDELNQCARKPPWYSQSLRNYLVRGKTEAVRQSLLWLGKY